MDQEKDIKSSEIVETEKQEISDQPNTGIINSEKTDEQAEFMAGERVQRFIREQKKHGYTHTKSQYKVLYVLQSEEHVQAFLKQKELVKYLMLEIDGKQWVKSKITTYDKFHSGNHEHTFDFVVFVFPLATSLEDILAQKDMYIFFSNVPLCQYMFKTKTFEEEEPFMKILSFFQTNFQDRIIRVQPYQDVDWKEIYDCLKDCAEAYDKKFENDLKIAFNKFDKDGSGSIDREELADLSKELGSELTEEHLQNALKDLDLNGDGVIDIDEFARWYFSGMKPYSGLKRSLLQIEKQSFSLLEALKSKEVSKVIHENLELTTHDFSFTLNDPKEAHIVDAKFHIIGPSYVKLLAEYEAFKALNAQGMVFGEKESSVYGKISISLEPGNLEKNKKFVATIDKILNDYLTYNARNYGDKKGQLQFDLTDTQLTISLLMKVGQYYLPPPIPVSIVEGLKDVEQYIHSQVTLGYDTEELLNEDKPLIEHLLKGFKFQTKISHLKYLKNALMKYFDGQKQSNLSQFFQMWGPAMMFGSEIKYKINFNDLEELKNHPYASQLLLSFHTILTQAGAKERDFYINYKEHIDTSIFTEENQKLIKDRYTYQSRQNAYVEEVVLWENVLALIDGFTQKTDIEGNFLFENYGVIDFKIQGKGFGKWLAHLYTIQVFGDLQKNIKQVKYYLEKISNEASQEN